MRFLLLLMSYLQLKNIEVMYKVDKETATADVQVSELTRLLLTLEEQRAVCLRKLEERNEFRREQLRQEIAWMDLGLPCELPCSSTEHTCRLTLHLVALLCTLTGSARLDRCLAASATASSSTSTA